jgi:hypothetical protein
MRCLCSLQRPAQPVCWRCAHCVLIDLSFHMLQSPAGRSSLAAHYNRLASWTFHGGWGGEHRPGDNATCGTLALQHPLSSTPALSLCTRNGPGNPLLPRPHRTLLYCVRLLLYTEQGHLFISARGGMRAFTCICMIVATLHLHP